MALAGAVAMCGASGTWSDRQLPPMFVAAGVAFLLQWCAFAYAWKSKSERFFDLVGSATFISVVLISLLMSKSSLGLLDVVLSISVIVWALRLGVFLAVRVHAVGSDRRFGAIKQDFLWFFMTWTLQGTWVVVTAAATTAVVGDGIAQPIGLVELIGLCVWLIGFSVEVVADEQKKKFRRAGSDSFVSTGLWRRSRHPNYFGEILLWTGLALAALPSLEGWRYGTLFSPVFVWMLLMKVSGAPMLEAKADRRWGGEPSYEEYKNKTPLLVPRVW